MNIDCGHDAKSAGMESRQQELPRSFWQAMEVAPNVGVAVVDPDGTFLAVNHCFASMICASAVHDVNGQRFADVEDAAFAEERIALARAVAMSSAPCIVRQCRFGHLTETFITAAESRPVTPSLVPVIHFATRMIDQMPIGRDESVRIHESRLADWGPLSVLTKRQREVLALLRSGEGHTAIAKLLGIAAKTVESHRDALVDRLGVGSTLDAIRIADAAGLTLDRLRSVTEITS